MNQASVLVVDDDRRMLDVVSRILLREQYQVIRADGPRQALDIVKSARPVDLVVSDVSMPDMLDTQLVREIVDVSPRTRSMLMTAGVIDPVDLPDGVPALRKPFLAAELLFAVRATLAQFAQLGADLQRNMQRSSKLQQESKRVCSEAAEAVRDARPFNLIERPHSLQRRSVASPRMSGTNAAATILIAGLRDKRGIWFMHAAT